jgi:hypothetical protein
LPFPAAPPPPRPQYSTNTHQRAAGRGRTCGAPRTAAMAEVAARRAVGVPAGGGGDQANLAAVAAAMRGRGEVDTSSPFQSVRQAVDLFGGGAAAVSQWRHPQAPPRVHLRPEVSQPERGRLLLAALVYATRGRGRGSGLPLFSKRSRVAVAAAAA